VKQNLSLGHVWRLVGVLILSTLVPSGLGLWLDHHFNTDPVFFLACASIGIIAGTIGIVRIATRALDRLGKPPETKIDSDRPANGKEDRA
jgi:F0F1-type ATP synthase assembly protein I